MIPVAKYLGCTAHETPLGRRYLPLCDRQAKGHRQAVDWSRTKPEHLHRDGHTVGGDSGPGSRVQHSAGLGSLPAPLCSPYRETITCVRPEPLKRYNVQPLRLWRFATYNMGVMPFGNCLNDGGGSLGGDNTAQ